jgi:TRAP-type transport system periplasmic protein
MVSRIAKILGGLAFGVSVGAAGAFAQDLPRIHLKVIGNNSNSPHVKGNEEPFWTDTVTKASKGAVTADFTPLDQLAIDDKTMMRLLKLGLMDVGIFAISKISGDDPRFEGCDLAGVALDIQKARAACEAYRPVMDRLMQKDWNAKLMAVATSPPQVIWCRVPIAGMADLKGKKVRAFNPSMRDLLAGVGAEAISMSFAEVVPALQRGTIDCGITGNLTGNMTGWPEVVTHVYPLYMGWSIVVEAFNMDVWKRLDPKLQAFFQAQYPAYENKYWSYMDAASKEADSCNYGRPGCTMGKSVKLTEVAVKSSEAEFHKKIVESSILAGWKRRVGPEAAKEWNDTVGKALGFTAQ